MKDLLADLVRRSASGRGRHTAREYLQARMLESLQRQGAMVTLAIYGGTALRFLFGLPRSSADLIFALEGPVDAYAFRSWVSAIEATFAAEGYDVELRISDDGIVNSASVLFPGLLHDLGQSKNTDEVLAIKLNVDTRPPHGAGLSVSMVRRHVTLRLQHHDRPSLLAGKLHALLQRPFTTGHDLYDLQWYLTDPDWPTPNFVQLNNALAQTRWPGPPLDEENWREVVAVRLAEMDWERARADVAPFVDRAHQVELLTLDNLLQSLEPSRRSG